MNNIFLVNLYERADRLEQATAELGAHGVAFKVWQAIKKEDGRMGLILTMKELFIHCLKNDYQRVLVFEDDVKILAPEFATTVANCVQQLPPDFDLFYLGCNLYGEVKKYSQNLLSANGMYSSHAVLYSKKAIRKILRLLNDAKIYDTMLVNTIQKEDNCYCSFPLLVSQHFGYSDIAKREINYEKFIEKRYAEKTKGL